MILINGDNGCHDRPRCADCLGRMTPLQADQVQVQLGRARILHGVDLVVESGQVVALLGANGSGKSTLLRASLGLVPLSGGGVELFGTPLGRGIPWHRIGYVPQRITAATGVPATAEEVVRTGLLSANRWFAGRRARAATDRALESVGLAHRRATPLHELSGGQQQRVSIARALVREPDLLLLDEPMAGVDHPSQEVFADLLAQLKDRGITTVVVLHEPGVLGALVDRAVVLRQGQVVHDGDPPEPAPFHDHPEHQHVHAEHGQYAGALAPHQRTLP